MLTIYHNTRCGKSRCALEALQHTGKPFEVIEYLKTPPTAETIRQLLAMLGKKPIDIIRQKESVFQENFKGKTFSDAEWIQIMVDNPILIERPIVTDGQRAWIARDQASLEAIGEL